MCTVTCNLAGFYIDEGHEENMPLQILGNEIDFNTTFTGCGCFPMIMHQMLTSSTFKLVAMRGLNVRKPLILLHAEYLIYAAFLKDFESYMTSKHCELTF